jgi:hypothetical protein
VVIQIVEDVKRHTPLIMDFIEFGGIDLLEKAVRIHAMDNHLAVTIPKMLRVLEAIGTMASISEIQQETLNLKLCQKCQEIIEREKHPLGAAVKLTIIRPVDRITRVLRFMDNFLDQENLQIAGMDALITFCRNADAISGASQTDLFVIIAKVMQQHRQATSLIWRSCMAYSILASYHAEYAVTIFASRIHEQLIEDYPSWKMQTLVQQQVLWLFSAFVLWQRTKRLIQKSKLCMDFLRNLVVPSEENKDEEENNEEEHGSQETKKNDYSKSGGLSLSLSMTKTSKSAISKNSLSKANSKSPNKNQGLDNSLSGHSYNKQSVGTIKQKEKKETIHDDEEEKKEEVRNIAYLFLDLSLMYYWIR